MKKEKKTNQASSTPSIRFDEAIKKLNGLEKERIQYARARWEFLRRNDEFKKDFEYLKKKRNDEIKMELECLKKKKRKNDKDKINIEYLEKKNNEYLAMKRSFFFDDNLDSNENDLGWFIYKLTQKILDFWKLADPHEIILDLSFEDNVEFWLNAFKCLSHKLPPYISLTRVTGEQIDDLFKLDDEEAYICVCKWVASQVSNKEHDMNYGLAPISYLTNDFSREELKENNYFDKLDRVKNSGTVDVAVNLHFSKERLIKDFENMIDELKPHIVKSIPRAKVRKHHRYDQYPLYIKVYDLRKENNITYKAIAKLTIPDDFATDPKGAEIKVIQYYKEACRLIEKAANF